MRSYRPNKLRSTPAHARRAWLFALIAALSLGLWLHSAHPSGAASLFSLHIGSTDAIADGCPHGHLGGGQDRRSDAPSPADDCCRPACEDVSVPGVLPTSAAPTPDRVASFAPPRIEATPFTPRAPPVFVQPRAPPTI